MIIVTHGSKEEIMHITRTAKDLGFKIHESKGVERTIIGLIGDERKLDKKRFLAMPGVENVLEVLKPYKLASREFHPSDTVIDVNGVEIGGKKIIVMAGPCTVEDRDQILKIAAELKKLGVPILRGGAFKPRTSPYSFQGLGEEGLKCLAEARSLTGMPVITEVMDTPEVKLVAKYADILQIGARNMQNFKLLKAVGKENKPVFLKRGMSATLTEFLMSAEYIMSEGNHKVILCERGIRTFVEYSRNTLDLNIVPMLKKLTHLPVIVDPSHGTGRYELVTPMAKAGIACGGDGLMIEVHTNPEKSFSDADQTLNFERFENLLEEVKRISVAVDRE